MSSPASIRSVYGKVAMDSLKRSERIAGTLCDEKRKRNAGCKDSIDGFLHSPSSS